MQRRAWVFRLKKGKEQDYRKAHLNVWPELIAAAQAAGLRNHSIFLSGDLVFAYAEAEDLQETLAELDRMEVTRRWNEEMSELMQEVNGSPLEEVCHF